MRNTFWRHEDDLQGVIDIRHQLNPYLKEVGGYIGYCVAPSARRGEVTTKMFRAALLLCPGLGIQRVLITCDTENIASLKTRERCDGVLEREGWSELAKKSAAMVLGRALVMRRFYFTLL